MVKLNIPKLKLPKFIREWQLKKSMNRLKSTVRDGISKTASLGARAVQKIRSISKTAVVVLLLCFISLGGVLYSTGIIDTFFNDPSPVVEVNNPENETPTVMPAIPENPDVVSSPSYPIKDADQDRAKDAAIDEPADGEKVEEQAEVAPKIEFVPPFDGPVIRGFGFNYSPTFADYRYHGGIDIKAPQGAPVKAAAAGKVVKVSYNEQEKFSITIDHGAGWQSRYSHLAEKEVEKGQVVGEGQKLGAIDEPGLVDKASGPHLHFSITFNGQNQDPLKHLPQLKKEEQ